jgi:hypothetical protein
MYRRSATFLETVRRDFLSAFNARHSR